MELDEVQQTHDAALQRALADLSSTTNLRPEVVVDFTDPDGLQYHYLASDGSRHGAALDWQDDEEVVTVRIADLVQEDAMEEIWGDVWPRCPGHGHPAEPSLTDGEATWVCPRSRQALAKIGSLTPT